jgi:hypothetical protein
MCFIARMNNADGRMSAMQRRAVQFLEIPLLCFRDQKIAEDLDARD